MKSFKELEEGLYQRKREDDEYHNGPDPVKHTYKYKVSKDGGEHHERTVTTPLTNRPKHELEHLARKHLEKQGYKIHEEVELDEALDPSEIASNPKMYNADAAKKAYYHKNATAEDKKSLERHLDRHHGNKEWRKSVKEDVESICKDCKQDPCICDDDSHGFVKEEVLDVASTYKKIAVKHLKDMMSKDATQANKRYAKTMHGRALEASKMDNHKDALNHYRGVKEEFELEEARMSAAVKLQRAFQRQQEKSAASRKRGEELLNPPKKDEPKKVSEGVKSPGVGWMLKKDPKLGAIIKARKEKYKSFKQHVGKKIEDKKDEK